MNYLRALVMRYRGDIQTYGLWNEPNYRNWKGSLESYVAADRQSSGDHHQDGVPGV